MATSEEQAAREVQIEEQGPSGEEVLPVHVVATEDQGPNGGEVAATGIATSQGEGARGGAEHPARITISVPEGAQEVMEHPGYTIEQMVDALRGTWMEGQCDFLAPGRSVTEIIRGFCSLLDIPDAADKRNFIPPLVCGGMLYLTVDPVDPDRRLRLAFLGKLMMKVNSVAPMEVHVIVEELLERMHTVHPNHDFSVHELACGFAKCSTLGRPIAVCLLWSVCGRTLPLDITMHRYREMNELIEPLQQQLPEKMTESVEKLRQLLCQLLCMGKLLKLILFMQNAFLLKAGYPDHFFCISMPELSALEQWSIGMLDHIEHRTPSPGAYAHVAQLVTNELNAYLLSLDRLETNQVSEEDQNDDEAELFQKLKIPDDTYSDLSD